MGYLSDERDGVGRVMEMQFATPSRLHAELRFGRIGQGELGRVLFEFAIDRHMGRAGLWAKFLI